MTAPGDQSSMSWSSGESLGWWQAVESNYKSDLTKRVFVLIRAIYAPNLSEVESLIRRGADLDHRDEYDRTLLDLAKKNGRNDVVKLIEKWAQPGPKGRSATGNTIW